MKASPRVNDPPELEGQQSEELEQVGQFQAQPTVLTIAALAFREECGLIAAVENDVDGAGTSPRDRVRSRFPPVAGTPLSPKRIVTACQFSIGRA
jgi:hypothetical protein